MTSHSSDCTLHNGPANPSGLCDCAPLSAVQLAIEAYKILLQMKQGPARIRLQGAMATLVDIIAEDAGLEAEEVQTRYESIVADLNH